MGSFTHAVYCLMRPLVKRLQARGVWCIVYIDDGICAASTSLDCGRVRNLVISDLENVGFLLNREKSCLEPAQSGRWLGFLLDLSKGSFRVPEDHEA